MRWSAPLLLIVLLSACDGAPTGTAADATPEPTPDAAPGDAGAPDARPPAPPCTCDADEDCAACYAQIGRCCYDDPTIFGQAPRIVETCERDPGCAVCCRECAARSCEALIAAGDCPAGPP